LTICVTIFLNIVTQKGYEEEILLFSSTGNSPLSHNISTSYIGPHLLNTENLNIGLIFAYIYSGK